MKLKGVQIKDKFIIDGNEYPYKYEKEYEVLERILINLQKQIDELEWRLERFTTPKTDEGLRILKESIRRFENARSEVVEE